MTRKAEWVARRFKCRLSVVMDDIRECANAAVESANQLIEKPRNQFPFEIKRDWRDFKVEGWPIGPSISQDGHRSVSFKMDEDSGTIRVSTVDGMPDFHVFQRWIVKDEKCAVYAAIDGKEPAEYTADQIVQLALERLFFV